MNEYFIVLVNWRGGSLSRSRTKTLCFVVLINMTLALLIGVIAQSVLNMCW